ncbi:MAG: methyltransferase [Phycisphaerae bacterium]
MDGLLREQPGPVRVTLVGPGAVTRWCRPWLRDAAREVSGPRRWLHDLARYADQGLRRLPGVPLVSLEALELHRALRVPHELTVVDVSARVLAAVGRDVPEARCLRLNLAEEALAGEFDVVVAFNVISRVADGAAAMRRLFAGVRPGGLLLVDDRSARRFLPPDGFRRVAAKTYERTA